MNEVVKYLMSIGIKAEMFDISPSFVKQIPLFLSSIYKFYSGNIDGQSVLFAKLLPETIFAPSKYGKHESILNQFSQDPIVFVFDSVPSYYRKRLTSIGINYIVLDSQIYLPELYIVFSKNKRDEVIKQESRLTPSAQVILLYYLYHNENDFSFSRIKDIMEMPYPTVTKAISLLGQAKLCNFDGYRNKTVHFDNDKISLLDRALPFMKSPVKNVIYANIAPMKACKSGINALSEYSMINRSDEWNQVAISYDEYKKLNSYSKLDEYLPVHIEVWSYNPHLFSSNGIVDKISLYLSLRENNDERIQHELTQMIHQLW